MCDWWSELSRPEPYRSDHDNQIEADRPSHGDREEPLSVGSGDLAARHQRFCHFLTFDQIKCWAVAGWNREHEQPASGVQHGVLVLVQCGGHSACTHNASQVKGTSECVCVCVLKVLQTLLGVNINHRFFFRFPLTSVSVGCSLTSCLCLAAS